MEPRDRAAEEGLTQDVMRFRWRLLAACVLLTGFAMTQSAGLLVADTKLDLAVAPLDFLARAAHLWDGEGAFGQLQNQAYGYLWPMGPFFALGFLFDIPGWVVQRLWMALVLCVAFTGAAKLSRAFGVRSDLACILAGLAFVLSPRMLTVIGPSSIEVWPMALAPWVLLPLVIGAERGSARRAAALSALAVAMVGGVNAAATFTVIPLGAVWLMTREGGPRRRALLLWWPPLVLLGTLWWLVPLFTLGAYSPGFLDFIESAAVTTFPTTIFDALRGTSNWIAYVDPQSPAGLDLLSEFHLVLNGGILLGLGLAGVSLRRTRHRRFLVIGLLTGLFLITMGHLGAPRGVLAVEINGLLDTALAPLRNVHKFDPVVRLPLVLGLAFAVEELWFRIRESRERPRRTYDPVSNRVFAGLCVLAVAVTTSPFTLGRVTTDDDGFRGIPGYWRDAAAFLDTSGQDGMALLVPGSSFATYVWGEPRDEPMQALASSPWAVRNAVPLVPAGNIRMLDRIEQELARGEGGRGLTDYLGRAGITHLVVRNDLVRSAAITDPVLVHQAIKGSPGLRRVAEFGPDVGGAPFIVGDLARALVSGGWQSTYPAIEIYEVPDPVGRASGIDRPPTVVGGPEDLLDVQEAGLIGSGATVLASDVTAAVRPAGPLVLTDGLRDVERNFGRLTDATSATLGGGSEPSLKARVLDYRLADHDRWTTVARLRGASAVSATSTAAGAAAPGGSRPGALPFAAIDGDASTSWVSEGVQRGRQSWRVDFDEPVAATELAVTLGTSSGSEQLRLRSDGWRSADLEFDPGETRRIKGPATVSWLVVEDAGAKVSNQLDIAEVEVADRRVRRELVLPAVPERWGSPDAILLRRLGDARTGCAELDGGVRCRPGQVGSPEEPAGFSRVVPLSAPQELEADLTVLPRGGPVLSALVQAGQAVAVNASSTALDDPRASATAMADGDPGTTWIAPVNDITPTVELQFLAPQRIRGLAMSVDQNTAARRPEKVLMTWPGGSRKVALGEDGAATFPPLRTTRLSLQVLEAEPVSDFDFDGSASAVPVGISELLLPGVPYLPLTPSARRSDLGCGSGPDLTVNGRTVRSSVTASPSELMEGDRVSARLCGTKTVPLRAGENTIKADPSDAFVPERLVLGSADGGAARDVSTTYGATRRDMSGVTTDYVAMRENANAGWEGVSEGVTLEPQVFDGWRQGWRTAGHDAVTGHFVPERTYRAGLAAGLVGLVGLLVVVLAPRRRSAPAHVPAPEATGWTGVTLLVCAGLVTLTAGWAGLAVATVGGAVAVLISRARPGWEGWGFALLLAPAVLAYVFNPWQSSSWAGRDAWPHYVVVFTVATVSCWAVLARRPRRARDMPGRSTSQ